ncbi:MAG: hypothetical protein EBV31_04835 [Verrucomicrobia bacterium]|nr:hypothetical protein [Verrucomicrobiota bacterium]
MNYALLLAAGLLLSGLTPAAVAAPEKGPRREIASKGAGDVREEILKKHPELKDMTPEERQAWLKDHPEIAEKLKERAKDAGPDRRADFKLREKMKERFEKMTPEQKAEVLKNHPELKEKLEGAKK